jgi:hypothetical protein
MSKGRKLPIAPGHVWTVVPLGNAKECVVLGITQLFTSRMKRNNNLHIQVDMYTLHATLNGGQWAAHDLLCTFKLLLANNPVRFEI